MTRKLAGKFQQTDRPIKDKKGNPLTTVVEQLKRWAEHFKELLHSPTPEEPPEIPPAETELLINCNKPTKAEIKKPSKLLGMEKAAVPDEIPAEVIKADMETAVNMLHSLFNKNWEKEEVPGQWKERVVIKLQKKGDLRELPRGHTPVSARQSSQQSSVGEDERGNRPQAPRPTGGLLQEQTLC